MELITLQNVRKTYNTGVTAIYDMSLDIKKGDFVFVIGSTGCGKSTLMSIIAGLESKTSGEIYIDGKIGYMLQKDNLLDTTWDSYL